MANLIESSDASKFAEFWVPPGTKYIDQVVKGGVKHITINLPQTGSAVKILNSNLISTSEPNSKKFLKTGGALAKFKSIEDETKWSQHQNRWIVSVRILAGDTDITLCPTHSTDSAEGPVTILTPAASPFVKFAEKMFLLVRFNNCTPSSHNCDNLHMEITLKNDHTGDSFVDSLPFHTKKSGPSTKKQKLGKNYEIPAKQKVNPLEWLRLQPWFHDTMGATEAERLLQEFAPGTYLARGSSSAVPAISFSLKKEDGRVVHWRFLTEEYQLKGPDGAIYNNFQHVLQTFPNELCLDAMTSFCSTLHNDNTNSSCDQANHQ